jgi:hypothetical protein
MIPTSQRYPSISGGNDACCRHAPPRGVRVGCDHAWLPAASQAAITVGFDSPGLLHVTVTDASSDMTLGAGAGTTTVRIR